MYGEEKAKWSRLGLGPAAVAAESNMQAAPEVLKLTDTNVNEKRER